MPDVLTLKALGRGVVLLNPRDILEHIDLFMGYDARKYVENIIDELEYEEKEIEKRMDSDLEAYEAFLSSNRTAFQDVLDCISTISEELAKKRTDKKRITKSIEVIEQIISNQI